MSMGLDNSWSKATAVDGLLMLFKKLIELLPYRGALILGGFEEGTIFELETITEVASILIENPFRLRFTALIVQFRIVVTTVEAGAEICPAKRTGIFPSYDLGYVDLLPTLMAYSHIVIGLWREFGGERMVNDTIPQRIENSPLLAAESFN